MPNLRVRTEVATKLGMTPRRVQIWFQNKRAKMKRMKQVEKQTPAPSATLKSILGGPPIREGPRYLSRDILDIPFNPQQEPKQQKAVVPVQWTPFSRSSAEPGLTESSPKPPLSETWKQPPISTPLFPPMSNPSWNDAIPAIPVSLKSVWVPSSQVTQQLSLSPQYAKYVVPLNHEMLFGKQTSSGIVPHPFQIPQKAMQYIAVPQKVAQTPSLPSAPYQTQTNQEEKK